MLKDLKNLSEVRIEGASIVRVVECVDTRDLVFRINYPIPEGGSDFPECAVMFSGVMRYAVERELRGRGQPVIQRVEIVEVAAHSISVRIHTDQGLREVNCASAYVREGPFSEAMWNSI